MKLNEAGKLRQREEIGESVWYRTSLSNFYFKNRAISKSERLLIILNERKKTDEESEEQMTLAHTNEDK
jgi:hypothetical protein